METYFTFKAAFMSETECCFYSLKCLRYFLRILYKDGFLYFMGKQFGKLIIMLLCVGRTKWRFGAYACIQLEYKMFVATRKIMLKATILENQELKNMNK